MSEAAAKQTPLPSVGRRLDELFKPWNSSDAPGLVVGIAHHGTTIYRRGYGLASIEHAVANTPQTRMRIGSTSKHFAALAALLLAEEGKLDLDAPARRYLPELTGCAGTPTLRQFMLHTSGLRDPAFADALRHHGVLTTMPEGSGLALTLRFRDVNFPPGERIIYCNNGYHLLSIVIERVSGKSLQQVLAERIFEPLDMHDTMLLPSDMQLVPNLATFHVPLPGGGYRRGIYPSDEILGSGGMVSTIDDMLVWMAHLRSPEKKVGKATSWTQMLQRPRYSSGAEGSYCLGLVRSEYRGMDIVWHSGGTYGCTCQMLTVPEKELDIIIMCNRMDGPAMLLANRVIDTVFEGEGLAPLRLPAPAQGGEALLGLWYSPRSRSVLEIVRHQLGLPEQPEVLGVKEHNQLSGLLYDFDGLLRKPGLSAETLEISRPPLGQAAPQALECRVDGMAEYFERMPDFPPSAADIAGQVVGRYRYQDFGVEVALEFRDGQLRLDLLSPYGASYWDLEPYSADVLGLGKLHVKPEPPGDSSATVVLQRRGDAVVGFWINTSRERNIWFERCAAGPSA